MGILHHEHSNHEILKLMEGKLNKVYLFEAFMSFTRGLMGIFAPVYLYFLGYTIPQIALYAICVSIVLLALLPLSIKLIHYIGYKYTLLLSLPLYLVHISSLYLASYDFAFFNMAWLSFGAHLALFWPAFHSEIVVNGQQKTRGKDVGTLQVITIIFGTMAPLIGGFVLEALSYFHLLILSTTLVLIGSLPLLLSKDIPVLSYQLRYKDYISLIQKQGHKASKQSFFYEGASMVALNLILWPILIYLLLRESFFFYGLFFTAISFISVLLVIKLRNYLDKHSKEFVLKKSSEMISLSWLMRSFALFLGVGALYVVESFSKLALSVFNLSFMSIFYTNAEKKGYMNYIITRELFMHAGKISILLIIMLVFTLFEATLLNLAVFLLIGTPLAFQLQKYKQY